MPRNKYYYLISALFLFVTFFLLYFHLGPIFLKDKPLVGFFAKFPFKLGLDLQGGSHLVYGADLSGIDAKEKDAAMSGLRDVIERRINLFGAREPIVQVQKKGDERRLIVELAGVYNVDEAIKIIGETPYLEFKIQRAEEETKIILDAQKENQKLNEDPYFISAGLTGRFLKKSTLQFDQTTFEPIISLEFDETGKEIFAKITKENVGKPVAIYLDGVPISVPVVREEITGGKAQITGKFAPKEAKILVQRLNSGALPIPIKLISQERVGPTLGKNSIDSSIKAGLIGIAAMVVYFIAYYRFSGLIAVFALLFYFSFTLLLFKFIPVTLTLPGIIGFLMSLGMAIDANVLIFERTKEELKAGKTKIMATEEGFKRAWSAIYDSNLTTILVGLVLFWIGTSAVKGFALTLIIGVAISMLSGIWLTRIYLRTLANLKIEN